MNWRLLRSFILTALAFLLNFASCEYSETATLTYLPNSNILAEVSFKLTHDFTEKRNFKYFSRLIYDLAAEFGLQEGKISFTRGLWDSKLWGKCPNNPTSSGFQFHGHFEKNFKELTIEERYNQAMQLISSYFCASLSSLQYSNAIKPTIPSFPLRTENDAHTLIGLIPNEPLCIENLQPWLELLPCGNRAGLAEMFKPEAIYQSNFHSIELEFVHKNSFEMNLKMVTVYDLNQWDRNRNWSLTGLFGIPFKKSCPFTSDPLQEPKVILRIPNNPVFVDSLHQQKDKMSVKDDHLVIEYSGTDLKSEIGASNVIWVTDDQYLDPPHPFRAYRFKSGTTDDFGGFGLVLENDSASNLEISVIESIPWLFNVFLHKGEFALNSEPIPLSQLSKYLKEFLIEPAINRKRSLLLQSRWMIPPQSRLQMYFPFEREFLRIDEFPPNSERGIELPGALIFYHLKDTIASETTNTLLFTWPIPDGTMPFNVITMTCTLAALFYGSFFNIIFRRFYLKHPNDPPPGIIPKILWNFKKRVLSVFKKSSKQ